MNQYLVWNIKYDQWRMSEFVGFTDDGESAGIFSEEYLRKNTGIYDYRTGDYANNLIIEATKVVVCDFNNRVHNLPTENKKALKKAIMKERKRRGLAIELIEKDGLKYCPHCKKQLVCIRIKNDVKHCGKCNNPFMEIEEW